MNLRRALALSLALNLALGAGLAYKLYKPTPKRTPRVVASEPAVQVLASPPAQPEAFGQWRLPDVRPAHAYAGQSGAAFAAWRAGGRQAIAEVLGYAPKPFGGTVRVTERTEFPTVIREKVYLKSHSGFWLPGYMLVPRGLKRRGPAVLALPGHDGAWERGARAVVGMDSTANYMRAYGLRLAEAGYVVFSFDVAGIGELRDAHYFNLDRAGLLVGDPYKGLMLEQVHEAIDYMISRPEVDAKRLGAAGISLGGELALYAGVLDPRVKFVASSGFFGSLRDIGWDKMASLYVPELFKVADVPDWASMLAPVPLLVQVGETDTVLGPTMAQHRKAFEKVHSAYRAAGATEAVRFHTHPGGHVMVVEPILDWLGQIVR